MSAARPPDGDDVQRENRAVLDAVRLRRDALYDGVMALEHALATPAGERADEWCEGLHERVVDLRRVLQAHVAETEGDGGFFDDVRDHAPQLLHAVERLEAEHATLLAGTEELERSVAAARRADEVETVRVAGLDLIHRVLEHRHRGAELVYDAYSVDISAGD